MHTLGIIGFGNFGQFMVKHLKPFFDITVYDRKNIATIAKKLGVKSATLSEVASKEIVVLAIPVQYLKEVLQKMKKNLRPNALVFDVASVKIKPIRLMKKYLPATVEIIGTHPLFGQHSGKNGIKGLKMTVCPVRCKPETLKKIRSFLTKKLKLQVIQIEPQKHDQSMAYVQALTFFIGKAMGELKIPDLPVNTATYEHLLYLKNIVENDSKDLFLTIEKENPFAKKIRLNLFNTLKKINRKLD